jgi:hypothetical protein
MDKGGAMKCGSCKREGNIRDLFKQRVFPRFPKRIYYLCKKCGAANRPENSLNPKQRGTKKTLEIGREIARRYKESSEQISFKILVWGPGSQSERNRPLYEKRRQIRNLLRANGMEALFSEEIPAINERGRPLPFDLSEMLQTEVAHLFINLAGSLGSLLEAQQISSKLPPHRCLTWLPVETQSGFASALASYLENLGTPPLYFNDEDVKACVLSLASEDWVEGLRTNEIALQIEEKLIHEMRILRDRRSLQ